jgi:hypothetical protein
MALNGVYDLFKSNDQVLKVDAVLSVIFFFSNDLVQEGFKMIIPELVHTLLVLGNNNDLEAITDVLEGIIQRYSSEVANFAPKLVSALCSLILTLLNNDGDAGEKMLLIAGFMRTMCGLISSMEGKSNVVLEMYYNSYEMLIYVFKERKSDFYAEVFDIVISYLWTLKTVDQSMWNIFTLVVNIEKDDLCTIVDEMASLLDNFISFGGEQVLSNQVYLNGIESFIRSVCIPEDDYFFDEDHISGCRIIESLLLNLGNSLMEQDQGKILFFIEMALNNYAQIESESFVMVYSLNVVMNCFILHPLETMGVLSQRQFLGRFFDDLYFNRLKFLRVHDKKICTLFVGELMKLPFSSLRGEVDVEKITIFFSSIFTSLPKAIEKRNKLKLREAEGKEASSESSGMDYDSNASDIVEDRLDEDIYFETPLDYFDPFKYISSILSSPVQSSFGVKMLDAMNEDQKRNISEIVASKYPKQII